MNPPKQTVPGPLEVIGILKAHWRRWLSPAAALGLVAAAYAAVSRPTWQASQALIIRAEAAANDAALGKFSRTDEMKTVQETMLELVKGRAVLLGALKAIGPPTSRAAAGDRPTDRDIEQLRQAVKLSPPKGAEFGATEVFYLEVRDHDRGRAIALNQAISAELQAEFQQLRGKKAQSMIAELTKTAAVAKADLNGSIARLSKIERQVGSDLSELRVLNNEATSGDSAIRRTVTEIESELRQARAGRQANEQLLGLLRAAEEDRGRLLATPNRLLESQPSLRRLKDGLSDAQLHTAALLGRMSAEHPLVQAAKQAEEEIGRRLHDELAIAVRGAEGDVRLGGDRIAALESQLADATGRLSRLAAVRAAYSAEVAETNSRTRLLERAEQSLADARAAHASAQAASLLSCVDVPDAGVRPVSPSAGANRPGGDCRRVVAGVRGGVPYGSACPRSFRPGRVEPSAGPQPILERGLAKGRLRGKGVAELLQTTEQGPPLPSGEGDLNLQPLAHYAGHLRHRRLGRDRLGRGLPPARIAGQRMPGLLARHGLFRL